MIAYLRVSTGRQGASGLGLDAQRAAIAAYAERVNEPVDLELIEVETATGARERPVLAQALREAKQLRTFIVTAKLDRLARSVAAICAIQESGVKFVALDLPETENPLFLYVVAALAEYEAKLISERTKAALDAKRAKGWKPRCAVPITPEAQAKGQLANWSRAVAREQKMAAHAESLFELGLSLDAIAQRLNAEGYRRLNGGLLDGQSVRRMLDRRTEAQGRKPMETLTARRKRERLERRILYANMRAERKNRRKKNAQTT